MLGDDGTDTMLKITCAVVGEKGESVASCSTERIDFMFNDNGRVNKKVNKRNRAESGASFYPVFGKELDWLPINP